jgi:hypothetical protein
MEPSIDGEPPDPEKVSPVHDLTCKITLFTARHLTHHAPQLEGEYMIEMVLL